MRVQRGSLIAGLMVLDCLGLAGAVMVAPRLVTVAGASSGSGSAPQMLAILIPVAIGFFALNRLYVLDELLEGSIEYGRVVYGCTLTVFGLSVLGFWWGAAEVGVPSRKVVAVVWACALVAVLIGRFVARRIVRALRRRGYLTSRALIVGLGAPGLSLARHFRQIRHAGIEVVGFIDDYLPPGTPVTDGLKVLGPPSALARIAEQTRAAEVIAVPTAMAWESFQDLIRSAASLNGHAIRLAPGFRDILAANMKVHQLGFMPLLTIERARIVGLDAWLKRLLDCVTAAVLLAAGLSLLAILVPAMALTRARPLFQRVKMVGPMGTEFHAVLLNTAEPGNGMQRLISRLRLDRVPQLANVVWGQMSIVGPRPIPLDRRGEYQRWVPNLLTVKPGITGPWAVRGTPASLDAEMEMDLFYIRNYTIWSDLEIIVRSAIRLLAGHSTARRDEGRVAPDHVTVHG